MVVPSTGDGAFHGAILPDFSRDRILSDLVNDNNIGVTRLSAHIVTRSFPADRGGVAQLYTSGAIVLFFWLNLRPVRTWSLLLKMTGKMLTLGLSILALFQSMVKFFILCLVFYTCFLVCS
ncbi:hypothetical protein Hanom_Chr03g00260481 [Helianthus anomalus]